MCRHNGFDDTAQLRGPAPVSTVRQHDLPSSATERDLHHLARLDVQDAIGFELDELALDRLGTDHHHCHKEG